MNWAFCWSTSPPVGKACTRMGEFKGRIFTPRQVKLLYEAFGEP